MIDAQEYHDTSGEIPVRGFLHLPTTQPDTAIVLTHGAGANCNAPLLVALAEAFSASGLAVLRCDLPFRQARPSGPPPRGGAERDQAGLRAAVNAMRCQIAGRIFLGGHSYGGRQASMLAAADPALVPALLLLSYPLHPPERPDQLRTAHFPQLEAPSLFVSGARDGFATPDEMKAALKLIPARTELITVPSAGHELATKKNRPEVVQMITAAFRSFAAV